ncbi:MAG: isoprenylcysteine carboxylmethyltransferase family protein [Eubacteriales bacterium]
MNPYKILGLLIYFSYYISFYIKLFLQKRHGITTIQIGRGSKPKRTHIIEVVFAAVFLLAAAIQIAGILLVDILPVFILNNWIRYFGIMISASGIIVLDISMAALGDSWRGGLDYNQRTELITTGIYKFSRNPAFVGFDLFFIGMSLLFSNIINLTVSGILILVIHQQIADEEKFLTAVFGDKYLDYQRKTGKYFGRK